MSEGGCACVRECEKFDYIQMRVCMWAKQGITLVCVCKCEWIACLWKKYVCFVCVSQWVQECIKVGAYVWKAFVCICMWKFVCICVWKVHYYSHFLRAHTHTHTHLKITFIPMWLNFSCDRKYVNVVLNFDYLWAKLFMVFVRHLNCIPTKKIL